MSSGPSKGISATCRAGPGPLEATGCGRGAHVADRRRGDRQRQHVRRPRRQDPVAAEPPRPAYQQQVAGQDERHLGQQGHGGDREAQPRDGQRQVGQQQAARAGHGGV